MDEDGVKRDVVAFPEKLTFFLPLFILEIFILRFFYFLLKNISYQGEGVLIRFSYILLAAL